MPTFSSAQVTDPFLSTNELLAPMLAYAERDSKLGALDINRQRLGLEQRKLDLQQAGGQSLIDSLKDTTGTTPPADSTPFEQKMGAAEGGGTADKVNDAGYAGQFQFGAGRLADLGFYTPAPGENLKANEWKGKFNIAPYNVATLQDFLNNPAAQHAAFVSHVADIDKTIDATPGADKFDRNGLRAVAHLGGTGGMQAFVAAGGNLNRHDSNGTTLKNYYQRFADGGPTALQKAFGSVHGPGGPPSDLPAVQPGGNVGTGWVDPNAPLPVPPVPPAPFNSNAGPRVAGAPPAGAPGPAGAAPGFGPLTPVPGAPSVTAQPDVPAPVSPSPVALRTGGTDFAGPGGGPVTMGPVEQPNTLYQTGLPGVSIRGPGNALAPPPVATAQAAPAAPPTAPVGAAPAGMATRPPPVQPPAAPSRVIPLEPVLPNGLTASQVRLAGAMVQSGAPVADVAAHLEQWKQANRSGQQQAATQAALDAQATFERQKYYQQQQIEAEKTQYQRQQDAETARRNAAADARAEAEAKRAGLPPGYRVGDNGQAVRIEGLPTDTATLEANKIAGQQAHQQFERENTLRDEFQKLTGDFRTVQTSYENIRNSAKVADGASDMSLLYNYVRLLDPTSVVRESEFAAAAASGSLGQRVQGAVERVLSGARMPDSLRESFVRESKNLYDTQLRSHNTVADQYEKLARDNGLEPGRVVTRFARPQEDTGPPSVKSVADYNKLPSGTVYTDPDGHTRKKP